MQQEKELFWNIAPIKFNVEKLTIGRLQKLDEDAYRELRNKYLHTHTFRFDKRTNEILNVSVNNDVSPIGEIDEVNVNEHLLLLAKAIQHSFFIWMAEKIIIVKHSKKLVFRGKTEATSLILSRILNKIKLPIINNLEVVIKYEVDCRLFYRNDGQPFLGLVLDIATSNVIDIPVSELQRKGLDIKGRYVSHFKQLDQKYIHPKLELLGQVIESKNGKLYLADANVESAVEASEVFLEPRLENLKDVIQLYFGRNAPRILQELENQRKPFNSALGKLEQIKSVLNGLKQRKIVISTNVNVELGELLNSRNDCFPKIISTQRPTMLFGPQGRKPGYYPDAGITNNGPFMYMMNERNSPLIVVVCEREHRGRVELFMEMLRDGFPDESWQSRRNEPNPFQNGLIGKFRLSKINLEYAETEDSSPEAYKDAISKLNNRLNKVPDLAVVQIKEAFKKFYGDNNPYYVSKAMCMTSGIPTQSVVIEKIDKVDSHTAYLLNSIALQAYAKLDGTPWVLSTNKPSSHELVIGIGSAEIGLGRLGVKTRYIGIATVFQGDGRYLVWGVTREIEFDEYASALLENLRSTIRFVSQQGGWQEGDKVRLVCHVYKRLRDCEVMAVKKLVRELVNEKYQVEFAFLDISWHHSYYLFDPSEEGKKYWDKISYSYQIKGKGIPQRGICLHLDNLRGLLHLTGASDIKTDRQGIPQPLLIELHPDSDFQDMTYLMRQIYHFAYMSWRGFQPSTEPVTISYSRMIAKMLGNLKNVSNWNSAVLSGPGLRDRCWFL